MKQQLADQCDQLIEWGKRYTYHWFWGITEVKPLALNPNSISEQADFYKDHEAIHVLRVVVTESYRSRNPISRFFIWMFNYNDLVKKDIALTYIDVRSYAIEVKENNMTTDERSPALNRQVYQKLVEAGSTLGKQASSLGSAVKSMCFGITTFIKNQFLNEAQPELNAADAGVQNRGYQADEEKRIICRNKKMQDALKVLGIVCQIRDTYSEKDVKSQWRLLAKKYHPDHNGAPEKFREIHEAKVLLDKFAALQKQLPNNARETHKANSETETSKALAKAMEECNLAVKKREDMYKRAQAVFEQIEINTKQREEEAKQWEEASKQRAEEAKQWEEAKKQREEAAKQREEAAKLQAEKRKRDEEEIQMMNEKLAAIGYGPLARRPSQDQNQEVIGESKEEHDSSSSAQLLSVSITNVSIFRANVTPSVLVAEAPEPAPDQIEAEIKESGGSVFRANL